MTTRLLSPMIMFQNWDCISVFHVSVGLANPPPPSMVTLSLLLLLQGQYVQMACSRLGSRVLEAVWSSASVSHRQIIAQELGNPSHQSWLRAAARSTHSDWLEVTSPAADLLSFSSSGEWKPAEVGSVRSPRVGQICPVPLHPQESSLAGDPDGRVQEAQTFQWHFRVKAQQI